MGINSCGQLLIDQGNFFNTGLLNWDTTAKTANFTAVNGNGYFVNTTSAAVTVTLPAGSAGDIIAVYLITLQHLKQIILQFLQTEQIKLME
jgi:hypothetical protein